MFLTLQINGSGWRIYKVLYKPALFVGGLFALISLVLSTLLIHQHLRFYSNPAEQKWIIGVLFMVPVYTCDSILSLWSPRISLLCDILRSCYEAFALYCFGSYLIACLGGEEEVTRMLEDQAIKKLSRSLLDTCECETKRDVKNGSFWKFFSQPQTLGRKLYTIVKFGLVQYMILKIFCAILQLFLEMFGVYGNGEFKIYYGYPYLAGVLNFSQMWALYCLVHFYSVTHNKLHRIRPLAKFISFKAVVFATWWQGVIIAILSAVGILPRVAKFQTGLQDFLICAEMAIAAIAHVRVFPVDPYQYPTAYEHMNVPIRVTEALKEVKEGSAGKETVLEHSETILEAPGTSVTESVQDVFLAGGEHVVKDVVLTMTQAIEPVEKGVTKIQETFHHMTTKPEGNEGTEVDKMEHIEENISKHVSEAPDPKERQQAIQGIL